MDITQSTAAVNVLQYQQPQLISIGFVFAAGLVSSTNSARIEWHSF